MKIRLSILSFLTLLLYCSSGQKTLDVVSVFERQIQVNNKPYTIKGICYHPVPKGSDNKRSFENLSQDLSLMKEAGINTIRVYEPINDSDVLDQLHQVGIKVIIGFGYKQNGIYDIFSGTYIDYVNKYKDHNAILMWELGNEYNYHPERFEGDIKNWYTKINEAAIAIHEADQNHPVSSAHGELPDVTAVSMATNIDVWGLNVYRWDNPEPIFKEWKEMSKKPMYLSESGGDSYMEITKEGYEQGENQKAQADANRKILDDVFKNTDICSGITMFSFTDGWWKAGNPAIQDKGGIAPNSTGIPYDGTPNEEYWGIVDIDRNKKETFNVVKQKYTALKDN